MPTGDTDDNASATFESGKREVKKDPTPLEGQCLQIAAYDRTGTHEGEEAMDNKSPPPLRAQLVLSRSLFGKQNGLSMCIRQVLRMRVTAEAWNDASKYWSYCVFFLVSMKHELAGGEAPVCSPFGLSDYMRA